MKKLFLCALSLHLGILPCLADVIPSRYDEEDARPRQAVQKRLVELGLSPSRAQTHTGELTSEELSYFGGDFGRLQAAGSLYWYEWLLGTAMLAAAVGTSVWIYMEHSEHNEHEHD